MSFFTDVFKAVATVATDVTAKATSLAIHGAAEVAGVFDENAKKNMHYAALEAEKQIRRNPVIDAINEIDNSERELTKRLIRYIDMIHDIEHPIESSREFTQRVQQTDLTKWAVLSWIPYIFHECFSTRNIDPVIELLEGKPDTFLCNHSKPLEIAIDWVKQAFSEYKFTHITKDYYVAKREDTCLIGFCGTVDTDWNHLIADISIGNLVAGYHYKMLDLACEYYETVIRDQIANSSKVLITGHSLGAGIGMYLNILLYMLQESGEVSSQITVESYGFGVPCVLPRVFKNRISHRMLNVIDEYDPVPKYYKNDAVAHVNNLVHIDGSDWAYRYHGEFHINPNRFNPLNQIDKFNWDKKNLDFHYMKNYTSVCKFQLESGCENSHCPKNYQY